jgi:hypothetical protein
MRGRPPRSSLSRPNQLSQWVSQRRESIQSRSVFNPLGVSTVAARLAASRPACSWIKANSWAKRSYSEAFGALYAEASTRSYALGLSVCPGIDMMRLVFAGRTRELQLAGSRDDQFHFMASSSQELADSGQ